MSKLKEKKIEKIITNGYEPENWIGIGVDGRMKIANYDEEKVIILKDKINEIIDYLNSK